MAEGVDIGVVSGELELTDNFTKRLFMAANALKQVEQASAAAAKKNVSQWDLAEKNVKQFSSAIGLGLGVVGVGAVISFGKHVLDSADKIQRLSDRTGIATDDIQRLDHIANQSGNSLEELTTAIGMMQVRLNDVKTQAAIRDLGVDFEALRAANPFDQMVMISEGLQKVSSSAEQSDKSMQIFGRGGIGILPTLKSNMREVGDQAAIMSKQTVQSMDEIGDKITALKGQFTAGAGESIVALAFGTPHLLDNWKTTLTLLIGAGGDWSKVLQQLARDTKAVPPPPQVVPPIEPIAAYRKHLNDLIIEQHSLTKEQEAAVNVATRLGESNEQIAAALGVSAKSVENYLTKQKEAIAIAKEFADKQHALTDNLFGVDVLTKAGEYALALGNVNNVSKVTAEKQAELHDVFQQAYEVEVLLGRGTEELALKYKSLAEQIPRVRETTDDWINRMKGEANARRKAYEEAEEDARKAAAANKALAESTKKAAEEAEKLNRQRQNTTTEVNALNLNTMLGQMGFIGAGTSSAVLSMARAGYSFNEVLTFLRTGQKAEKPIGPKIPGFWAGIENFGGGPALVGERGPEVVNLPRGSSVRPIHKSLSSSVQQNLVFNVHGTDNASARRMCSIIMDQLKRGRLLPSA